MTAGQKVTNVNGRKGTVVSTDASGGARVLTPDSGKTTWYSAAQIKHFLRTV